MLVGTGFARHASRSIQFKAGDVFVLASMLGTLGLLAFILAAWQWRLTARSRLRLLLVCFVSLVWCFSCLCWYDVTLAEKGLPLESGAPSPLTVHLTQTAAALLAMGALVGGLIGVVIVLSLDKRGEPSDGDGPAQA